MGCVYVATNTVNGKQYVGKTTKTLRKRMLQHRAEACRGSDYPIHRAIARHGFSAFRWEILASSNSDRVLDNSERAFIAQLGTIRPGGYNLTPGGDGCIRVGELKEKHAHACRLRSQRPSWLANNVLAQKMKARDPAFLKKRLEGEYRWMATEAYQEHLKRMRSKYRTDRAFRRKMADATKRALHDPETRRRHLEAIRRTSGDPLWREKMAAINRARMQKPVMCVETAIRYASSREASQETGAYRGSILAVCGGKRKTAGGLHWRYAE